jgi:GntR family transcriptional regulator
MNISMIEALEAVPTPKYWQVRQAVLELIAELRPGDRLPTEGALEARLKVSRGTVRRALADLEREGRVSRQPGRGTFVAQPRMPRPLPELTSFSEHLRSLGFEPGARLISYRTVVDPAAALEHFASAAQLARVVRLRTADGSPVGLHTLFVPAELAERSGFTASALRSAPDLSLYASIGAAGVEIDAAREDLAARMPTAREAELLRLSPGSPVLEVIRRTYDAKGVPIELVQAVYRADRYDYIVWLRRSFDSPPGP